MVKIILICLLFVALATATPTNRTPRILGGSNVPMGEIPYQASLMSWGTNFHLSGGALLNSFWVLTTARNLQGIANNGVNIVLGIIRLDAAFTSRRSSEIRRHPLFSAATLENNLAVVRSSVSITFTTWILPIALSHEFIEHGLVARVSGWGATNPNLGNEAVILQKAYVTTGPCVDTEFIQFNFRQQFCAGTAPNSSTTVAICTRDVGSPLVHNNMAIGIAFFHDPRECGRFLDGYQRISYYRSWIMGNIPE